MNEFLFELGKEATDKVTGRQGKLTARCQYLLGMNRYEMTWIDPDGNIKTDWFDEPRLQRA